MKRMYFLVIALISCLTFPACLHAQILTVTHPQTGGGIEGVLILSKQTGRSLVTNHKGQADISAFATTDTLSFNHLGYHFTQKPMADLVKNNFQISLGEKVISLDEVVLSANKWEQEKRFVPNQIATVSMRDIYLTDPQTTADMLANTGEVFIQKSQLGGGSPMIRGFSANSVLIVVDGVRMNNAIFRGGNLQNVIALDAGSLESAEVVFGPGSVMYGSDALGGVMDFHTRTPELATGQAKTFVNGNAFARYSSANQEKTTHAGFNLGGRKWASFTSLTFSYFGDLRAGSNRPEAYPDFGKRLEYVVRENEEDRIVTNPNPNVQVGSGYRQFNALQKIRFRPSEKLDFVYSFHLSHNNPVPRYDRLIEYRNGRLRFAEWNYTPQNWMMHSLAALYRPGTRWADQIKATLAYQKVEEGRSERRFGNPMRTNRTEEVGVWSLNLEAQKEWPNGQHQLFYGLEAVTNDVASTAETIHIETGERGTASTRYPDGGSTYRTAAAYFSHKWLYSKQLTFTSGLRYNRVWLESAFNDRSFFDFPFSRATLRTGALNGSLGLVFRPAEGFQLNANLSSGFRAPNVDDMGKIFDSQPGAVVVPNPQLRPEQAWNAEVGVSKLFFEKIRFDLTGYYTHVSDLMVRRDFTFNGQDSILYDGTLSRVQAIVNASEAFIYGFTAKVKAEIARGWIFTSTFNYTEGEEIGTGVPLRHVPPIFGDNSLEWRKGKLQAAVWVRFNAWKRAADIPAEELEKVFIFTPDGTPAWYTVNLRASYRFTPKVALNAAVENVFDQFYQPYSSGIPAPGRNVIVALKAEF